jgi:hypothetical protein
MLHLSLLLSSAFAQDADVRALNLSPDADAVDMFVDGAAGATGVGFLQASGFEIVPSGPALVEFAPTGLGAGAAIASSSATLSSSKSYTSILYGSVGALHAITLLDDSVGIASGTSRLQILHAAEGFGAMDLYVPQGKSILTDDIPYRAFDSIDVPVGSFDLFIDLDNDSSEDWTFELPPLVDGEVLTLAIVADGGALTAVLLAEDGTLNAVQGVFIPKPSLRFVQMSPDLPTADLFVGFDFVPEFTNLTFGTASDTLLIRRGSTAFTLAPAGTPPTSPYGEGSGKLESDVDYIAFSYGLRANLGFKAFTIKDMTPYPTQTGLRVIHTAVDLAASIDIYDDGVLLHDDVAFGRPAGAVRAPGPFTLGIDEDNDGILEHTFSVPDFGAGAFVNLFVATDAAGTPMLFAVKPNDEFAQIDVDL